MEIEPIIWIVGLTVVSAVLMAIAIIYTTPYNVGWKDGWNGVPRRIFLGRFWTRRYNRGYTHAVLRQARRKT